MKEGIATGEVGTCFLKKQAGFVRQRMLIGDLAVFGYCSKAAFDRSQSPLWTKISPPIVGQKNGKHLKLQCPLKHRIPVMALETHVESSALISKRNDDQHPTPVTLASRPMYTRQQKKLLILLLWAAHFFLHLF